MITLNKIFIYRDGIEYGQQLGYNNIEEAKTSLIGCEDYKLLYSKYRLKPPTYEQFDDKQKKKKRKKRPDTPEEYKDFGYWTVNEDKKDDDSEKWVWILLFDKWRTDVWEAFVKEHYTFEEKELRILIYK